MLAVAQGDALVAKRLLLHGPLALKLCFGGHAVGVNVNKLNGRDRSAFVRATHGDLRASGRAKPRE